MAASRPRARDLSPEAFVPGDRLWRNQRMQARAEPEVGCPTATQRRTAQRLILLPESKKAQMTVSVAVALL